MNISFGKKIPIAQSKVFDRKQNAFVNATLYELDGKDKSDVDYFINHNFGWGNLKYHMTTDIDQKHRNMKNYENLSPFDKMYVDNNKFYSLEVKDGQSAGFCETNGFGNNVNIEYIECDPKKEYKYCGQVIIYNIANQLKGKQDSQLAVNDPADHARKFYTDKCGFTEAEPGSRKLKMDSQEISNFVDNFDVVRTKNHDKP